MSVFSDVVDGAVTVIGTGVTGLQAFNHPVDSFNEGEAAIVLLDSYDPRITFGGNSFEGRLRIIVLTHSADAQTAFSRLYDLIDPVQTTASVIKAIRDNGNLNGKVDSADVVGVENIGRRAMGERGYFAGADVIVQFVKTQA